MRITKSLMICEKRAHTFSSVAVNREMMKNREGGRREERERRM